VPILEHVRPTDQGPPPNGSGGADEKNPSQTETAKSSTTKTTPMTKPESTKDRNAEVDFRGEKRSNETHASVTNPEARLFRKGKGKPAQLCYMGHALMENRSGLIVEAELTRAARRRSRRCRNPCRHQASDARSPANGVRSSQLPQRVQRSHHAATPMRLS
jgi:hypothetical protein